jgi:serine/threonine protein kinase
MSRSLPPFNPEKPLGGRYKIISQLGVGGFGRTFLAEDLHLPGHPQCVIKQLKSQIKSDDTLQMARRCFNTEAQVLYQLGNHDQIPRLLAHFEDNHEFYLAQELIEGDALTQELVEGKPWSEGRVIILLKDILKVLVFVHGQQVIHRDLKPSNLIRRRHDRKIVLIDFGAVKQVGAPNIDPETGLTNLTISIGTQGYMPNEQLAGKPRFSSDIFAVGVIGIQAITGIHPRHFSDDHTGEIEWHHRATHASAELIAVLDRMVRYDFRERYPTAIEALEALEPLSINLDEPSTVFQPLPDPAQASDAHSGGSAGSTTQPPQPGIEFSNIDLTMSGNEPLSTALWTPTEPFNPSASKGTGLTQAVGRPHQPDPTDRSKPMPSDSGRPGWRRLLHPWSLVAIVGAVGIGVAVMQMVMPQFINQWIERSDTGNPSSPIGPKPSPSPAPSDPKQQAETLLKRAEQLQKEKKYNEALKFYDQSIALQGNDASAYAGRCETLNLLQRPEEAIVSCNDALAYQPNYPEALWSKGNALLQQNRVLEALRLYEEVTARKPDFAMGWVRRGVALQKLGRSAEALNALDVAIRLYRNSAEAWLTRGEALFTLQRYDEAIASLDKALQLQPGNSTAIDLRQRAVKQRGF